MTSTQDGDLVSQHQDLDVFGCAGASVQVSQLSTRENSR
jgi:hypothetical protein